MIVPMKKVHVLIKERDLVPALKRLRKIGILHVTSELAQTSEHYEQLTSWIEQIRRARQTLDEVFSDLSKAEKKDLIMNYKKHDTGSFEDLTRILDQVHAVNRIIDEKEELEKNLRSNLIEIERMLTGGEVTKNDLDYLRQHGIDIHLFKIPKKSLAKMSLDGIDHLRVCENAKHVVIALRGSVPDVLGESSEIEFPLSSRNELLSENSLIADQIASAKHLLVAECRNRDLFQAAENSISKDLEFEHTKLSMSSEGPCLWIDGFVPVKDIQALKEEAKTQVWGLLIDDPTEDEVVPTKLENNRFVRIIQPVFDILGTVPGYREIDISVFFLAFFSVFFAMIIGDAGYGTIFLAGTILMHGRTKRFTDPIRLLYLLSIATVIWGSITGTWFGSPVIAALPFFRMLIVPTIATFPEILRGQNISSQDVQQVIMYMCFLIGVLQLGLACIINFKNQFPSLQAVSQLGWFSLMIGLYKLVLNLVIGKVLPEWALIAIAGGLILIVLFGKQEQGKSVLKGFLAGLAGLFNTFLDSISAFSNIISYIRLFAVGMASVAIASSFNNIAAQMPGGAAIIASIIIVLIGHGLNIIMGLLSVVVHGVRLNMLEFSGQLGLEWTGIPYKPFSEMD